jgi:hypothetical protein
MKITGDLWGWLRKFFQLFVMKQGVQQTGLLDFTGRTRDPYVKLFNQLTTGRSLGSSGT